MKVCVLGGSGFIGTQLCNIFTENKVDFFIIDKTLSEKFEKNCLITDVRDLDGLVEKTKGVDVLINLAAEHKDNVEPKSLYDEVNVVGAENVCKAAEINKINSIVFTSSVAVYGEAQKNNDETAEINYINDYGRTKWEAEEVYRKWYADNQGRNLTIIRPTVVFGEENRGNVYNLLKQVTSGSFMMVGSGNNYKSMAYVGNVAKFISHVVEHNKDYNVYNYIDKPDFSVKKLVDLIQTTIGKKGSKIKIPYFIGLFAGICFDILAFLTRRKFSISRIRIKKFCMNTSFTSSTIDKIGFTAPLTLEEGLKRTIQYEFPKMQKS